MEPWARLGLFFVILGCVGSRSFFDAFFDRQKVGPKSQKSAKLSANGEKAGRLGRPGGMSGGAGGGPGRERKAGTPMAVLGHPVGRTRAGRGVFS